MKGRMIETRIVEETAEIASDEEYLKRYAEIGEMYYQKRRMTRDLKNGGDGSLAGKVDELNAKIREEESRFRTAVSDNLGRGKIFAFETLSNKFKLESYEKRVLLFFLFLEFFHVMENLCMEMEILELMDLENSPAGRIKDFKYIKKSAGLFKKRLLIGEGMKTETTSTYSVALSGRALGLFVGLINGEDVHAEPEEVKDAPDSGDCEKVGLVKEPGYRLEDVVLSDVMRDKVMFFIKSHTNPELVKSGILEVVKKGRGLIFLFYGPPGTGKSMLAEGIASYLGKKMLMAEMPKLTSRWFGETDKQIAQLFRSAREHDLVLCMDEADSFLYNREFGAQEHDIRFVNIMLQQIESFEGVAIFTTNMDKLLDPALERRISLRIPFTAPDEKIRARIWESHIPQSIKISEGVDYGHLARAFEFSGGYIKNAVMNAVRRLVLDGRDCLTMDDLLFGARMEKDGLFNAQMKKGPLGFAF